MSQPKAQVTVIPVKINMHTKADLLDVNRKRRVAAYARVSTDSDEQATSFEAQVDYYTKYIQAKPDWALVEIYTDDGISAVTTKHREGFNRMMRDAAEGKIDLIVTKSVSRFARNTVDSLNAVRKLKEKGIEIFFEKEAIWTLDGKGELLITIMSSLAQEESRSISANVTWGQRKRFADGKVTMPYKHFLGYERDTDGKPKIVESEAAVVRRIYHFYLNGVTPRKIAQTLTGQGIPTPAGKIEWPISTIMSILQNEKYKGEALLQKTFCVDFLTKKVKKNEGEVKQYYVAKSHPAIVEPEVFDLVQEEIAKNKALGRTRRGESCFSNKIRCGECGAFFGSKVWGSNSKYRRVVWQCNGKYRERGKEPCRAPHLSEEDIQQAFVDAFNRILIDRERYIVALEPIV
jgi:DNA invertase Pin-like site-specific DNA recombinase